MDLQLKKLRKLNGLTQEELAKKVGAKLPTYRTWERGTTMMSLEQAMKVSEVLGCALEELVGRVSNEKISRDEMKLLSNYRILPDHEKIAASTVLEGMAANARAQGEAARDKVAKVS